MILDALNEAAKAGYRVSFEETRDGFTITVEHCNYSELSATVTIAWKDADWELRAAEVIRECQEKLDLQPTGQWSSPSANIYKTVVGSIDPPPLRLCQPLQCINSLTPLSVMLTDGNGNRQVIEGIREVMVSHGDPPEFFKAKSVPDVAVSYTDPEQSFPFVPEQYYQFNHAGKELTGRAMPTGNGVRLLVYNVGSLEEPVSYDPEECLNFRAITGFSCGGEMIREPHVRWEEYRRTCIQIDPDFATRADGFPLTPES